MTDIFRHHLDRLVLGSLTAAGSGGWMAAATGLAVVAVSVWRSGIPRMRVLRATLFCVAWVVVGVLPVVVAGYESPRHVYLASAGWALLLGQWACLLWAASPDRLWRPVAAVLTVALLGIYLTQVRADVRLWNVRAQVSEKAAHDLDRELAELPDGTLVLVGVPARSWEWALPFVARPPYASTDHWTRVSIISPRALHCCRVPWEAYTRDAIAHWEARPDHPPVVGLSWDGVSGAMSRVTSAEDPSLGPTLALIRQASGPLALDQALTGVVRGLVAPRLVH